MQFEATPRATATAAVDDICNTIASDTTGERHAAKSQLQQQQQRSGKTQRQQEHKMQITSNEEVRCVCGLVAARVEVSPSSPPPPPCLSTGVLLPHRQHASAVADDSGCCKCNKKSIDVPQADCIPPACGQDKICADNKNSNESKTKDVKCESESSRKDDQCSSCCNSIKSKSHRRSNNNREINKLSSNCSCFQRIATILAMLFCFTWCGK